MRNVFGDDELTAVLHAENARLQVPFDTDGKDRVEWDGLIKSVKEFERKSEATTPREKPTEWAIILTPTKSMFADISKPNPIPYLKAAFQDRVANVRYWSDGKSYPWFDRWLESKDRREFEGFEAKEHPSGRSFNMYSGTPTETREGDYEPFHAFVHKLADKRANETEWLLQWLAHLVQCPANAPEKMPTAPVFTGAQGQGKSLLAKTMRAVVGMKNSYTVRPGGFARFLWALCGKSLVISDESAFMKSGEIMETVKAFVSEPLADYEEKGQPRVEVDNISRLFIITNKIDAVRLDPDDRRFTVYNIRHERREKNYWTELVAWLRGNIPVIRHYLLNKHVDTSFIRNSLRNADSAAQKSFGDPVMAQLATYLGGGVLPGDKHGSGIVASRRIKNDILRNDGSQRMLSTQAVTQTLIRRMEAIPCKNVPLYDMDGKRRGGGDTGVQLPWPSKCAEIYLREFGVPVPVHADCEDGWLPDESPSGDMGMD